MPQRNAVAAALVSSLVLATLLLPASLSAAAPLKGVAVKLGRNPGGGAAARTFTPDSDGRIDFGVLPAGSYYVMLLPAQRDPRSPATERLREAPVADLQTASVTIDGAVGGPVKVDWDFEKGKAFDPSAPATERVAAEAGKDRIVFESDGQHHALFATVVKSKSNMANN